MEVLLTEPWLKGLIIGAAAGAGKAVSGVVKNHPDADFQFKFKKIVPALVIGAAAGAVLGAQELPITDVGLESVMIAFGAIGIDEILENLGKGIWKKLRYWGPIKWLLD